MGNFVIPKTTSSPTVPAGGTFGQILAKTNEFDFNTQWINNTDLNAAIGTGTINYLSKFTGSNTLGNSLLFDNGTKVGIGTTSFVGSIKLAVNGQIGGPTYSATYLDITGAIPELRGNSGIGYYSSVGNHIFYGGSSVEYMRLTTAGLLGIGTNSPSEILHISGTTSADRSIRLDRDISSTNGQFYLKGTTISGSPALLIGSGNSISGNFTGISYMGGSNNVGIGMSTTIAPTSPLTVGRNITQTVAGGYTYISATSALTFTQNTLSNGNVVGFLGAEFYYAGNSAYGNSRLLNMTAYVSNTSASNTMRAGYISARTTSGGSATTLTGYTGELVLSGTGAVINAIGQEISLIQDGIKTTTNLYGIKVQDLTNSAGTVTNTYGIYFGNLTAGTQTNAAYGIYQSSATNKNYFAGNVGIGTTTPNTKAEVYRLETVNRTSYNDILTISAGANTNPFTGHGGGILFRATNYISGTALVDSARIGSTITDNSVIFTGADLFFDVSPLRDGILSRAMTIKYNGAIGIGTTTPTAKLQVKGSGTTPATTALLVQNLSSANLLSVLDNSNVGIGKIPSYPLDVAIGDAGNVNSAMYVSGIHSDGRAALYGKANTTVERLLYWWHSGGISVGTGSSARGGAVSYIGDISNYGPAHQMYFMETSTTFGPNNIKYRLGVTTSTTNTGFASGVSNNLTNIESNTFTFTAKSHTFLTGTTTGNQSLPNQYTPLHLSTTGNVGIETTSPAYKLDVFGIASSAGGVNSNIGYNITPVVAPIAGMTATPVAGSGLNIGQYYYAITYYNSLGETNAYYGISAVTTAGNQQVNLASIPISTNTTVIGRKIYRGKVGEGSSYGGLIATIANNTATTYSDTIPDSSVPGGIILDRAIYGKPNLSANYISVNSVRSLVVDTNLTAVGYGAGTSVTNAPQSTFVGAGAGVNVTSGAGNTLVGKNAGSSITTGSQNSILGDTSGNGITTGSYNIGLGPNVLNSAAAGSFNIAAGYYTMNKGTGSYNILLGGYNWSSGTPTASYCTFIGGSLTNISAATNYQVNINDLITGISSGTKYVNILGSLGIGLAYGTAPVASAQVQIDSTAKGFLPPRMTTLQKIGITLPAAGLVIYDTDLNKLCVFTTAWETVTSI